RESALPQHQKDRHTLGSLRHCAPPARGPIRSAPRLTGMTHTPGRDRPVSEIFDPSRWRPVDGFDFADITYHRAADPASGGDLGTVRIAFDRPEVRNAFRPRTVDELHAALDHARMTSSVGCVLLTGNGPSPKDG